MKPCPFCAEEIQDAAVVCKHCGRDLKPTTSATPASAPTPKGQRVALGCLSVILLFLFVGWCSSQSVRPTPSAVGSSSSAPNISAEPEPQLELLSSRGYVEYSYHHVTGQVRNITSKPLANVTAVTTWYTDSGEAVKTADALIDFDPILPWQTSPFSTLTTSNPEMKRFTVEFKTLMGGTLRTKDSSAQTSAKPRKRAP